MAEITKNVKNIFTKEEFISQVDVNKAKHDGCMETLEGATS